jgi:3-oxoacyl-[acyl-carrier-protein] synthase-3
LAYLRAFGAAIPETLVTNEALGPRLGKDPAWIREMSGIEERRYAAGSVVDLAVAAGEDCLARSGVHAAEIGMLVVASGSYEGRFPGPAAAVSNRLGLPGVLAWDVPMASAGSLFGMALAARFTKHYGRVLVIAAEKMSSIVSAAGTDPGVAMLFGDGAAACLLDPDQGNLLVEEPVLESDGAFASALHWDGVEPMSMNGMTVILQAGRKIPGAIRKALGDRPPESVSRYLMHQANQNLIDRVAKTLEVPPSRFYSNIARYGNTSSASMLLAAHEWWCDEAPQAGSRVCFAAFGAGFHWGAMVAHVC